MSQNQTQTTYIPKFAFPFKDVNNINTYNEKLSSTPKGNYLFTRHGLWHGAPHFYGTNFDSKIQVIADGELVAYRLNSKYLKNSDAQEGKGAYSTGFFLVRHKLEYPKDNKLTFFSLYMHTAKKDAYNIIQNQTNQSNTTNYYTVKKGDTLGKIAKVHNTTVDKLRQDNNIADVNKIREGHVLIIKPFPSSQPTQNTPPPQTNPNSNPNFIVENPLFDEVVVFSTPIKIKAGEVIGLMGEYNQQKESDNKVLHLEVFANEEFNTFVQTAQRGDKNLPQSFSWARVIEIDSKDNVSIFEDLEDSVLPLDKDQTDDEIKINKSFRDLFNLIDKDHQNGIQPQEIEKAAEDIEIKKVTNNYIVKHSSEWDKTENMAEKLYKIMDKNQDKIDDVESLKKHYENEKERIYNLSFFAECKDKINGFPKDDKVYVMNVIGLVNQFNKECGCYTDWKIGFERGGLDKQNKYNEYIVKASKEYNIPCLILKSLIMQESDFKADVGNSFGYAGLTQVGHDAIVEAGFNIGKTYSYKVQQTDKKGNKVFKDGKPVMITKYDYDKTGDERFDPEKSIMGGAKVLKNKRTTVLRHIPFVKSLPEEEQWKYYLAAYNAGEGVVKDAYHELGKEGAKWEELTKQYPWISEKKSEAFNLTNKKLIQRNSKPRTEEAWLKIVNSTFYSPLLVGLLCQSWGGEAKYTEVREYVENIIKRKNQ